MPAPAAPRPAAPRIEENYAGARDGLGLLAPLTLLAALAIAAVSAADGASRRGEGWGGLVFWLAIFACAFPFAFRLAGSKATRSERLGLVVVFGLWLFLVKLLRDPIGFTYADELVHSYNVDRIVSTHHLFSANAILPLTPRYPGLETATAAVRLISGVSTFAAGVSVVAVARVIMVIALFLFFERIGASARTAGVATLFYMANPGFVFFDAQFSYESLALPLAMFTLYAVIRWMALKEVDIETGERERRRLGLRHAWGTVAILMLPAVIVTHHATSYVLALLLFAVARVQREVGRQRRALVTPYRFGALTFFLALVWLLLIARSTWNYLSPLVQQAVGSMLDIFGGHQQARQLFGGSETATPIFDRAVAVSAAGLTALGIPFGLWRIWRGHRTNAIYLVLGAAGAAYIGTLGLRLVPSAWELANRASEFLFIGVGLVLALIGLERLRPRFAPALGRIVIAVAFGILLEGGVIAGWSSDLVLGKTFQLKAAGATLRPEGVIAAQWAGSTLPHSARFGADASNARLLGALGGEFAIAGTKPDVRAVIREPKIEGWHVRLLRQYRIRYLLVDQRGISEDALAGYFFATAITPRSWRDVYPRKSVTKFDRQPSVSRLYDSGDIVIYNISRLTGQRER